MEEKVLGSFLTKAEAELLGKSELYKSLTQNMAGGYES